MNRYLFILLIYLVQMGTIPAQSIWPGDVNNNGEVNVVDLLFWGAANGSSGPQRSTETTDWAPQPAPSAWLETFPNGINYAFADCDGNGIIDERDFEDAVEENFGLEQGGEISADGYANATQEPGPRLKLSPSATLVEPGAIVSIDLSIDDSDQPIGNFYGIALQLSYTTGLLEGNDGPDFDFTESGWIEGDDDAIQTLYEDESGLGNAQLGVTRTNQLTVPIETGSIGSFNIIVEDIIVGLEIEQFTLRIDSVLLVGTGLSPIFAHTDSVVITIVPDTSKLTTVNDLPAPNPNELKVFPNPISNQNLVIETKENIQEIFLIDALGRQVFISPPQPPIENRYAITLPKLPAGAYWIGIKTNVSVITRKIMVVTDG